MRRPKLAAALHLMLGVSGSVAGCQAGDPAVGSDERERLVPCRLRGGQRAMCGTLSVPETRAGADSRTLTLGFAVIRSEADEKQAPVVLIAGGPGQSAIEAFSPALQGYAGFVRDRDVLLLDQRGTGRSNALPCETTDDGPNLAESLSVDVDIERVIECREQYTSVDLGAYTTPNAVQDLVAVLDHLAFDRVNLVGISYGTRMASAFARRNPERVHAMVLDAVAPVDMAMPLSFATDADSAIDKMFEDCASDRACARAFGDLGAVLDTALEGIPEGGKTTTVAHPRTGALTEVEVDRDVVLQGIRAVLYVPEIASLLPLSISRAAAGDFGPLMAQFLLLSDGMRDGLAGGMFLSVLCTEDVPFITEEDVRAVAQSTRFGSSLIVALQRSCEQWVRGSLPDDYRDPVAVDVPTLLLSGELDPVTPPRWAEHAAQTLTNARTLTVPGAGHGTLSVACMADVVGEFLEHADPEGLDASCIEEHRRPPFFLDFAGPSLEAP